MKRLIALVLSLSMVLAMVTSTMAAENTAGRSDAATAETLHTESAFQQALAERYADSDMEYRTEVRWWMCEGGHTDETLLEELHAMYDAGFAGVELCQLAVSGMDETQWGLGSDQWNHDFHLVLNEALDLGMRVGITSGTNWNTTNIPGLNPDSQAAMQCVYEMHEQFDAGTVLENHTVPTSKTVTSGCGGSSEVSVRDVNQWIGAYAYQIGENGALESFVDVSEFVTLNDDGSRTLNWTVPDDASYYVFYYWMQGTAQESNPSSEPAYCVNYFDRRGVEAWEEFFSQTVLCDEELNAKIKAGNVQLFMDSLEFDHGDGITFYTEDFADIFMERKGYDVRPYLLLTSGLPSLTTFNTPTDYKDIGDYMMIDERTTQRIVNDIHDVQTDLYIENLLEPMEEWLNQYGIDLRAQISYGRYIEISEPAIAVDYPEAENLNQRNQVDIYRLWSGAAKLQNKVLSSETGATFGMAYGYDHQLHLQEAYSLYAAGFSRINWHVWNSSWSPASVAQDWPGYNNLSACEPVGNRQPAYDDFSQLNQHLGRAQQLLREGKSRADVGMLYMNYGQEIPFSVGEGEDDMWMQRHDYMLFPSTELQEHGYTYDYFSPEFLNADEVYYDAESSTLELAGYKALVIWQNWLTLDGAENVLELAKQGLKVVVVGDAAHETPYNEPEEDAKLAAVMAELKTLSGVACVETADDVLEALQAMGIEPYAGFESLQLLSQVREDEDGNQYLYLYNYCDGSLHDGDDPDHGLVADTEITMDGTFIPYYIDSWSGEVTQVADYRWENGKTILPIELTYGDIALYAFEAVDNEPEHVVSSDLDTYVTDDGIVIRATQSGTYETKLAYGRSVKTTVDVPAAYDITGWDLTVEAWSKGEEIFREQEVDGVLNKEHKYDTLKTNIETTLNKLTTWDNIPEVGKGVSGKGYYSATFNWSGEADGAYLDFGSLVDSMKIWINGQRTSDVNMNKPILDISDLLVQGENTIKIEYSSTLTNELLKTGVIQVAYPGSSTGFFTLWNGYNVDYRSYGPAQAVVVPYVEQNISVLENNDVTVNLSGKSDVTVDVSELSYDVSVSGAEKLATATLTFNVDGLVEPSVEPAEGWYLMGQSVEGSVLTAVIGNNAGLTGEGVIAALTAKTTGKVGTAKVELSKAELSAYVGEGETFTNVIYGTTSVETKIDYSTYDVNHDGVVNQLDLTRAQRYYGKADAVCDVNHDGVVDISDLILILNNYTK